MSSYIALLRGINVGGKNKLPMKDLKCLLEKNGMLNVRTYIQTGNIVFDCDEPISNLDELIESEFGFKPNVMFVQPLQFLKSIENCPFVADEGKQLHYYFCQSPPTPNLEKMTALKKQSEAFEIIDQVFYLHAPEGIGRSKLAERAEKLLGVRCTARNYNTVLKIKDMIE